MKRLRMKSLAMFWLKQKPLTEEDVRRIIREELKRSRKSGCKSFEMRDGRGFCRNCGFHHDEH